MGTHPEPEPESESESESTFVGLTESDYNPPILQQSNHSE
jgi:hypothetical protein